MSGLAVVWKVKSYQRFGFSQQIAIFLSKFTTKNWLPTIDKTWYCIQTYDLLFPTRKDWISLKQLQGLALIPRPVIELLEDGNKIKLMISSVWRCKQWCLWTCIGRHILWISAVTIESLRKSVIYFHLSKKLWRWSFCPVIYAVLYC